MLNPLHIQQIITQTLRDLGRYSPEMARLILGTFAAESGLTELYHYPNNEVGPNVQTVRKHGLMMMNNERISLVEDSILYNTILTELIIDSIGVDITIFTPESWRTFACQNIGFMVVLTYCYYNSVLVNSPDYDIESLAGVYAKSYADGSKTGMAKDKFITMWKLIHKI